MWPLSGGGGDKATPDSEDAAMEATAPQPQPKDGGQEPAPQFVDILQHLPGDVVFLIELCLPVQSLMALSAANVAWSRHLNEAHWHRIFHARWSHCYEGQCLTVSPSILSRLTGNYHSFWGTIEKAFMGDFSIVGDDGSRESGSLFEKFFALLQPAMGLALLGGGGVDHNDNNAAAGPGHEAAPPRAPPSKPPSSSSYYRSYYGFPAARKLVVGPPALPSSWKLACVLRDRAGGGDVLMGCRLCRQLDVFTEHMRALESSCPTQLPTWIVPCLCPALVHRRCLEARLLDSQQQQQQQQQQQHDDDDGDDDDGDHHHGHGDGGGGDGMTHAEAAAAAGGDGRGEVGRRRKSLGGGGAPRGWISYDTALVRDEEVTPSGAGALGLCPRCGAFYVQGFRLPTVRELVAVTWQDDLAWRRAGDCVVMWLVGVAIVSLSEALYVGRGDLFKWPQEGGHVLFWWMFQYVISLNIFLSPRFARVVDLLWAGPIFRFYAKLYLYFLAATFLMLCAFTPLPRRIVPWAVELTTAVFPPWLCTLLGWANFAALFVITSVVIFLFWKTNYRIPTVADLRRQRGDGEGGAAFEHPMLSIGGA